MAQKVTHWYILIMLGLFPLWLGWEGYRNLTAQKFGFFAIVTTLWLCVLVCCAVRRREISLRKSHGTVAVVCLMVAMCLSAVCSEYGSVTVLGYSRYDGLLTWLLYGGIFLGVCAYGQMHLSYAYALAFSGGVNCLIAIVQLMGYNCLWLFPNDWNYYDAGVYYTGEFLGLVGNVDVLSAFFCLTIPLFFGLYVVQGGKQTAPLLLFGGLNCFILLESGVSGGVAGLLLCVAVGAPMLITDKERLSRGLTVLAILSFTGVLSQSIRFAKNSIGLELCKLAAILSILSILLSFAAVWIHRSNMMLCKLGRKLAGIEILCVAVALVVLYAFPPASGTLYELSCLLHGKISDTFGSNRVTIWKEVWQLIQERPILGGGPGTLKLRTELGFQRFVEESGRTLSVRVDNAHNEYLNLWVNGGLASLLPYMGLMFATVHRWWKHRDGRYLPVLAMTLVAWWGQGLFGLGLCIVMPILWVLWGLVWSNKGDHNIDYVNEYE